MSVARQYPTTTGRVETVAPGPVETAAPRRLVPAQGVIGTRPAVPLSVIVLGIVALLVAAWGAAAPFAGPDFGFVADRATAWDWSVTSACLALGPGALAFLASFVVVGAATRRSYARRADLWVLGLIVALCGAWFVVGQYVWPVIYGSRFIAPSTVNHFMWKELAFAIGPGVILVFCGSVFMGWATRRQLALVADRYPTRTVEPAGAGAATAVTTRPRTVAPAAGNAGTMAPPVTGAAATGVPTSERPVVERSVVEQPVMERPATEQPVVERRVVERPVAETMEPPGTGTVPPV